MPHRRHQDPPENRHRRRHQPEVGLGETGDQVAPARQAREGSGDRHQQDPEVLTAHVGGREQGDAPDEVPGLHHRPQHHQDDQGEAQVAHPAVGLARHQQPGGDPQGDGEAQGPGHGQRRGDRQAPPPQHVTRVGQGQPQRGHGSVPAAHRSVGGEVRDPPPAEAGELGPHGEHRRGDPEGEGHGTQALAHRGARAQPGPRDEGEPQGRRRLHGRRAGADHHRPDQAAAQRQDHPPGQQRRHQGVVVGSVDQRDQDDRIQGAQREGLTRVATDATGQRRHRQAERHDRQHLEEAEAHHRGQLVVAGETVDGSVEEQEEGPVGGGGVAPERVDGVDVGTRAQREGSQQVGAQVVTGHLALRGVAEDVAREHRRGHHHGRRPHDEDPPQRAKGRPGMELEHLDQAQPHPHQQHQPPVAEHDRQQQGDLGGRGGDGPRGLAEEPGGGHVELQRRVREGAAREEQAHGQESDDGRLPEELPTLEGSGAEAPERRVAPFGDLDRAFEATGRRLVGVVDPPSGAHEQRGPGAVHVHSP